MQGKLAHAQSRRPPAAFFGLTQPLLRVPLPVIAFVIVVIVVIIVGLRLGLRRNRLRWWRLCAGGRSRIDVASSCVPFLGESSARKAAG